MSSKQQLEEDNEGMQSEALIKEINIYAYVGDDGRLVNKITYEMDGAKKVNNLSKDDFEIKIGDKNYVVKDLKTEGNLLILETEDFHYDGIDKYSKNYTVTHYDFTVTCTIPELNFNKDKCIIHTKILDDFTKGTFKASNGVELPYWLYLPEGVSNIPLMVWEHGGGEVLSSSYDGANITKNKGATVWIESGMNTAVLSFQYPENYSFGISSKPEELKMMEEYNVVKYELIQKLITAGQVDANRIYISGASSGGGAVLRFLMQYTDLFAAALPICAKDTIIPISEPYGLAFKMQGSLAISNEEYDHCYSEIKSLMNSYKITHIPIWFVQADNDPVCTSYTSKILYDVLNEMGAEKNKISMYTNDEMSAKGLSSLHSSWIVAFNDPEITKWIYNQSK
ncbi:MAG: hypothetical protein K0R46_3360 [Herbinix sp.]|nr:hypothetical protein [Herbinix sp.]